MLELEKLPYKIGAILLKPDAVDLGVDEFITDLVSRRMLTEAGASLEVAASLFNLTRKQTQKIYPTLDLNYFEGHTANFLSGTSIALLYVGNGGEVNLWQLLHKIRGKITVDEGFEHSIRASIPLPSKRERYDELTKKLKNEEPLCLEDYMSLSENLAHVPGNMCEFSGLLSLIPNNILRLVTVEGVRMTRIQALIENQQR